MNDLPLFCVPNISANENDVSACGDDSLFGLRCRIRLHRRRYECGRDWDCVGVASCLSRTEVSPPITIVGGEEIHKEASNIGVIKERLRNTIPSKNYDRASDCANEDDGTAHYEHQNVDKNAIPFFWRLRTERSIVLDVHLMGEMSEGEVQGEKGEYLPRCVDRLYISTLHTCP